VTECRARLIRLSLRYPQRRPSRDSRGVAYHTFNERIAKIYCRCCKDQTRSPGACWPASCKDFDVPLHTLIAIVVTTSQSSRPADAVIWPVPAAPGAKTSPV
jgi:hypothetical protein